MTSLKTTNKSMAEEQQLALRGPDSATFRRGLLANLHSTGVCFPRSGGISQTGRMHLERQLLKVTLQMTRRQDSNILRSGVPGTGSPQNKDLNSGRNQIFSNKCFRLRSELVDQRRGKEIVGCTSHQVPALLFRGDTVHSPADGAVTWACAGRVLGD